MTNKRDEKEDKKRKDWNDRLGLRNAKKNPADDVCGAVVLLTVKLLKFTC